MNRSVWRLGPATWWMGLGLACGCASASQDDDPPRVDPASQQGSSVPRPCEQAEPPEGNLQLQGFLAEAQYWDCSWPGEGTETARFTSADTEPVTVSGSMVEVNLDWEGAESLDGRHIYFRYPGLRGFFVVPAPSSDNPLPVELYVSSTAGDGQSNLEFAIDDGTSSPEEANLGPSFTVPLYIIGVGTGDVQINLHWDTLTDVDLHVLDPAGEEIYFGDKTSVSGGQLDLDSYAACSFSNDPGRGNENVYWPLGGAPSGEYVVGVHLWSDCETFAQGITTNYRVTVILNRDAGREYEVHEGTFSAGDPEQVEVARFTY
jgi:hypothetical protein